MFNYNLQSVLEYRHSIEEKILTEFSETERNLQREKDRLSGIREQQQALVDELKALKNRECNSRDIALSLKYTEELQKRENQQIEVVREATVAFEKKREDLLEAVKKRKMMETHKEHQFQDYKTDLISAERRETDDISIQRFARSEQ
jgi:flagellar FliJ protein